MNYRSISDLNNIILQRLSILPRDFDLIVGVPRSGMLPANLLALYLTDKLKRSFIVWGIDAACEFFSGNVLRGEKQRALFGEIDDLQVSRVFLAGWIDYFYFRPRLWAMPYPFSSL